MKSTLLFSIISLLLSHSSLAANLLCVEKGDDAKPWLIYQAKVEASSDLSQIQVSLADEGKTLLSSFRGFSSGIKTFSQNPKFSGYVKHINISYFYYPMTRDYYEIDLVVPGNLAFESRKSFSGYTVKRINNKGLPLYTGVSCLLN